MSYVSENLMSNEELIYMGHQAIYKYLPYYAICVFMCSLFLMTSGTISYVFALAGVLGFILVSLFYGSIEFGITNKRVIVKKGLFNISTFELGLNVIESVKVEQSLSHRILDIGNITIIGMGSSPELVDNVKHPKQFREHFQNQKAKNAQQLNAVLMAQVQSGHNKSS